MISFTDEDWKANKIKAGLGYIVFFLPLILCRDSKLGRHCANQGLILFILSLLAGMVLGIFAGVPLLGWLFRLAARLVQFALFAVGVMCFVLLTSSGKAVELPVVGKIHILD